MEGQSLESRKEKIKNEVLDAGTDELANELAKAGKEAIHRLIQDVKEYIGNQYSNFKLNSVNNAELKKLEMRIAISNENVEIGMEKKEIAVVWAMQKLGYSKEDIQKVLNLANQAYNPKSKSSFLD